MGSEPFDATRFRDAKTPGERARMAASAIESKAFVGRPSVEVKQALGSSDGYYGSDYYSAYVLENGRPCAPRGSSSEDKSIRCTRS